MIRSAGLVALGAALAGLGFVVWQQFFSRDAEIRAIDAACIKELAATGAKVRSGVDAGTPQFAKGAGEAVSKWLDGVTGGMSDAVCGTVRDACTRDFDGRICTAARERYR